MALTGDPANVTPGTSMAISVMVRSSVAVGVVPTMEHFTRATSTRVATDVGATVSLRPGEWAPVGSVGVVPSGADTTRLIVGITSSLSAGATFEVSSYISETADTLRPYFDGYSYGQVDRMTTWAGTPYASASIMHEPAAGFTLVPLLGLHPYGVTTEARTLRHVLLEDEYALYTMRDPEPGTGVLDLLFDSYQKALAGRQWLSTPDVFYLAEDTLGPQSIGFVVAPDGGAFAIEQDDDTPTHWHLLVPFSECDLLQAEPGGGVG